MKLAALFLLFAMPLLAQTNMAVTAPGCGPDDQTFTARVDKEQHPPAKAEAGKALIVFVEDDAEFNSIPRPTVRLGVDGKWLGATQGNSYSMFAIDPGEHHICARWQKWGVDRDHPISAAHFTAEAGAVYYFGVINVFVQGMAEPYLALAPMDSDEGAVLMSEYAYSTSHPKK